MALNVFGYENKAIVLYQISDQPASIARINVLLIHEETKSHYVWMFTRLHYGIPGVQWPSGLVHRTLVLMAESS